MAGPQDAARFEVSSVITVERSGSAAARRDSPNSGVVVEPPYNASDRTLQDGVATDRVERARPLTVQAGTTSTITPETPAGPGHAAALAELRTQADRIRYGCEHGPRPATTAAVVRWLATHGVQVSRSHASAVISAWRRDRGMGSTGELLKMTPELLAELDGIAAASDMSAPPAPDTGYVPPDLPSVTGHPDVPVPAEDDQPEVRATNGHDRLVTDRIGPARSDVQDPPPRPSDGRRPRGWAVAWLSFVIGGLVSVAANVAHTLYPTKEQLAAWTASGRPAETWTPETGAMLFAAFWPIALILAVEVLTRVSWRTGWLFGLARYGGTTLVAAVAAVMSYRHMSGLLAIWGEDFWGAHLGPLAVDGLMVVAAAALLSMSRTKNTGPDQKLGAAR